MQGYYKVKLWSIFVFTFILTSCLFSQNTNTINSNNSQELYLYAAKIESSAANIQDGQQEEATILDNKNIRVINLGPIINWKGLDYAPTISADGKILFYVSNRKGSKLNETGDPSHDFWASKKENRLDTVFTEPFNIDTTTNLGQKGTNTSLNEGAASIAADGQTLYFTGCNRPGGLGDCDIYMTTIEGATWQQPRNLGPKVNSKWWDSQPSITPDRSRIYFTSNRPGPNGEDNMDIWYSDYDFDTDEWKQAQNLTSINTKGKEVSPFIGADGTTLFFASDGHLPNLGGLDFYVTRLEGNTNSKPQNLGAPINTELDEQFITLPASGDIIYFSSRRKDLANYQGDFDIFMAFVPTFFKVTNVIVSVFDECSGESIPANITIKNTLTGKTLKDSVSLTKTKIETIVSNTDYGNAKDSLFFVNLEITAENPKYGKKVQIQRINKPAVTQKKEEAGAVSDEVVVRVTLGQRPELGTKIAEAEYVTRSKASNPKIANFRGLVMEQVRTWDLYPLLNYVFFDLGQSDIPSRYILFKDAAGTKGFSDTSIPGGTLDKYYHALNIYGFRLNKYPDSKIEIVGCNDGTTKEEKTPGLSKERALNVYNYLKDVWGISEDRMKLTYRDKPARVSNLKDSFGIVENRRVEILCNDWNIMKPVFDKDPKTFPQPEQMIFTLKNGIEDGLVAKRRIEINRSGQSWKVLNDIGTVDPEYTWDWTNDRGKYPKDEADYNCQLIITTQNGTECKSDPIKIPVMQITTEKKKTDVQGDSTLERYSLILFPFDSPEAGPINDRIMREYVYDRCFPSSKIEVVGHTDVVGLYDHNKTLSEKRANTVQKGIDVKTGGKYGSMNKRGVGEDEPLFNNELPEGRFYNRTTQVIIRTPVTDLEEK